MSDKLQEFVASHSEFFEKTGDCYVLKPDIHDLVEQYARLVDPDEFERVRQLVVTIQKDNREQLEQDIRASQEEMARKKQQMPEVHTQLDQCENEIGDLKRKMAEVEAEIAGHLKDYRPFYYSSFFFWLLAAAGIGCMYIGVFITVSGASSFLPLGLMFLITGVVLQSRQGSDNRPESLRVGNLKMELQRLESKLHVLNVRRATFLQQKSVAKQAIDQLQKRIRNSEQKKKMLNG